MSWMCSLQAVKRLGGGKSPSASERWKKRKGQAKSTGGEGESSKEVGFNTDGGLGFLSISWMAWI